MFNYTPILHCVNCKGFDFLNISNGRWTNIFFNSWDPAPIQREAPIFSMDILIQTVGPIKPDNLGWNKVISVQQPFIPTLLEVCSVLVAYLHMKYTQSFRNSLLNNLEPEHNDSCFSYVERHDIPRIIHPFWDENQPQWLNSATQTIQLLQHYRYCLHIIWSPFALSLEDFDGCA